MNRSTAAALIALLFLAASQNSFAQVILQDGEFDLDNDWTLHHIFTPADGVDDAVASVEQGSGDGNPGNYATTNQVLGPVPNDFPASTISWVILVHDADSYDPSDPLLGPLTSVRIEWDVRRSPSAPRRNGRIIAAFVRQDGFVWGAYDPRKFYTESDVDDWLSDDSGQLFETDFIKSSGHPPAQPDHPDFSASGSAIFFGLASGNSCPPTSDCTNTIEHPTDFDNFRVIAGNQAVPGVFTISSETDRVIEESTEVDFLVTRSRGATGDVSVDITGRPETASEGSDYGGLNLRVEFADGEFGAKTNSFRILGDDDVEGDETLRIELTNPTGGATIGTPGSIQMTIVDDDALPAAEVRLVQTGMVRTTQRTAGDVTTDFPYRFEFQAEVINDGPSVVHDLQVEIGVPKEGLAAFDFPAFDSATNEFLNCRLNPRVDPEPNKLFIFVLCDLESPLQPGTSQLMPAEPILVGYAETVSTSDLTPPDYRAIILPFTGFVDANPNNNRATDAPTWPGSTVLPPPPTGGSGAMSLPLLLLLAGLALSLRNRTRRPGQNIVTPYRWRSFGQSLWPVLAVLRRSPGNRPRGTSHSGPLRRLRQIVGLGPNVDVCDSHAKSI